MGRSLDGEQKESLAEETKAILDEARMVLPGIETLFGFQLVAVFSARFVELSAGLEMVHLVALTTTLLSMSFVITRRHIIGLQGVAAPRSDSLTLRRGALLRRWRRWR